MKPIKSIKNINATVRVPGSKSYTQRALITSALASGRSIIRDALISEDTEYLIEALRSLGANIAQGRDELVVVGTGGKLVTPSSPLYLGNNGTGLRFLTGTVSLGHGTFVLDGNSRMRQRPIPATAACVKGRSSPLLMP
jgi:3-phosphoshikimate 1-carboxyvinyltransferase